MRALRLDRVAAGTALALILALPGTMAVANPEDIKAIESQFPMPEEAGVPPLTKADIEPAASAAAPAEAAEAAAPSTTSSIGANPPASFTPAAAATTKVALPPDDVLLKSFPMPEPANVPPPTIKDIGKVPLSTADAAVAEKLKELLAGKQFERLVPQKRERTAIEAFYEARDFAPLWVESGAVAARTKAAILRLKAADADGLDSSDYAAPDLAVLGGADAAAAGDVDLKFTITVLTYARQAQAGRVTPSRISPNIDFTPVGPEPADVLNRIAATQDVAKILESYNPPHDGYKALKAKLAELRGKAGEPDVVQIPSGKVLKVMKRPMEDARVPLLRQRLGIEGDAGNLVYDAALASAVKDFQKQKKLAANGVLAQGTIDALNGRTKSRDINAIVSNMERWRWLPRDLGKNYVMVNVPDFTLKVVRDRSVVWRTKIVTGKAGTPSPSFSAQIETIQLNPTWHVPQSIIYGEYLPALQQDPTVLARMGLVMDRAADGSISIRQPPGERNALGRIKFNFPNKFQVYLHDTPDKKLFEHERRAYSHGCMRVQNPTMFGEVLASIALPQERYTAERFQRMFGSGEQWIRFKTVIPVHLLYMNAYVDDAGHLVVREDIYGYDGRVQSALRGEYVVVNERSQRSGSGTPAAAAGNNTARTAGARQPARDRRQMVQEQPRGFFFPFFR